MSLRPLDGCEIRIEMEPTTVPRPTAFAVLRQGQVIAIFTRDQIQKAMDKFDEMDRAYIDTYRPKTRE